MSLPYLLFACGNSLIINEINQLLSVASLVLVKHKIQNIALNFWLL